MLVLSRKLDEQIMIGDDVKITLVRVRGNTVRIGIDAPRDVRIMRGELEPKNDEPDPDCDQPSDREEAFAHPVARAKSGDHSTSGRPTQGKNARGLLMNRLDRGSRSAVYVGQVGRDGKSPRLEPAPLANFVSAS